MATFEQRLRTFTRWPHGGNHAREYMAAAGFSQNHRVTTHNDAVICFSCEMTLAQWDSAMDPVEEHLDRSPRCTFITSKMMNTQQKREGTFNDWPFDDTLSYLMVAAAGFFQSDAQTHTVTCYSCQLTLGPQQLGTDPLRAHIKFNNLRSPCEYLNKNTTPAERALPPSPPPTPPLLKYQCPVCKNRFDTEGRLRRHLVDPKKAHSPQAVKPAIPTGPRARRSQPVRPKQARKVIGRRTAPIGVKRKVVPRKRTDLASRITRNTDLASRITIPPGFSARFTDTGPYRPHPFLNIRGQVDGIKEEDDDGIQFL